MKRNTLFLLGCLLLSGLVVGQDFPSHHGPMGNSNFICDGSEDSIANNSLYVTFEWESEANTSKGRVPGSEIWLF